MADKGKKGDRDVSQALGMDSCVKHKFVDENKELGFR